MAARPDPRPPSPHADPAPPVSPPESAPQPANKPADERPAHTGWAPANPTPALPVDVIARTPLRARLLIWVLSIFTVVHVTLSLVVILYQRDHAQKVANAALAEALDVAQRPSADTAPHNNPRGSAPNGKGPPRPRPLSLAQARPTAWPAVIDLSTADLSAPQSPQATGPLNVSPDHAAADPLRDDLRRALAAAARPGARDHRDHRDVRVIEGDTYLIALHARGPGAPLAAVSPLAERDRRWHTVALTLLIALPVGLCSTGFAMWFIADLVLKPIRQVRRFAEDLSADTIPSHIELDDASPEMERLRNELEAAMGRIQSGYDQQARFLANVSHELKTPIAVARTEAEVLLAGQPSTEDLQDFTKSTAEEMERLGRMIESFLLLTRVRQGASRVRPRRLDANELLMASFEACAPMAQQYGVRVIPTLDESDHAAVNGNADLLQTAIDNLIRNAIRFTPEDHTVEIECRAQHPHVTFTVRDQGPGIPPEIIDRLLADPLEGDADDAAGAGLPPEIIDRLFEPFTQAADERRRGRGSGLGLQIAQGIAELHGGEIAADNLDIGCEFTLTLPLADTP